MTASALWAGEVSAQNGYNNAVARANNTSFQNYASISGISQSTADSYINKGIAQAGQVSMNYGCSVPTVSNEAVAEFADNVNDARESANAKIESIKWNKKTQKDVYEQSIGQFEKIKVENNSNVWNQSALSSVQNATHDENRRPYTGEPGSTYVAPNGDTRTYGPDGNPLHDYDHSDHGYPDKHPHDENGGHQHDWENGKRGPAYAIQWENVVGIGIVIVILTIVGLVYVVANDVTGIGVADDSLIGPLSAGASEGLMLIFQ